MSVVGNTRVGIPIVVLHDAEGAVIEVETKKGELVRGMLFEAEDVSKQLLMSSVKKKKWEFSTLTFHFF